MNHRLRITSFILLIIYTQIANSSPTTYEIVKWIQSNSHFKSNDWTLSIEIDSSGCKITSEVEYPYSGYKVNRLDLDQAKGVILGRYTDSGRPYVMITFHGDRAQQLIPAPHIDASRLEKAVRSWVKSCGGSVADSSLF
jgi:hypothetical protein